jgi:hypothetical protein
MNKAASSIIVAAAFVICGVNNSNLFANNSEDLFWCTEDTPVDTYCREVIERGTGTSSGGEYSVKNCSGQDCQDADEETEQEEQVQEDEEEEEEEEEEDQPANIRHNDPPMPDERRR